MYSFELAIHYMSSNETWGRCSGCAPNGLRSPLRGELGNEEGGGLRVGAHLLARSLHGRPASTYLADDSLIGHSLESRQFGWRQN